MSKHSVVHCCSEFQPELTASPEPIITHPHPSPRVHLSSQRRGEGGRDERKGKDER